MFAERHSTVVCTEEHAARLVAYNHNNAVRAGIVADPADSDWSSHRAYVGLVPAPPWLDVERGLALCGYDASPAGRAAFHDFVLARRGEPRDEVISGGDLAAVRRRLRAAVGAPVEISDAIVDADAVAEDGDPIPRHVVLAPSGTPGRPRWPGSPERLRDMVAVHMGVSLAALCSRDRDRAFVEARRLLVLVGHGFLGLDYTRLGTLVGLSAQAASKLVHSNMQEVMRLLPEARLLGGICWEGCRATPKKLNGHVTES